VNENIEALDEFLQQIRGQLVTLYAANEQPQIVVVIRRPGQSIFVMGDASVRDVDDGAVSASEQIREVLTAALHRMMFDSPKRLDRSDQAGIDLR
jgi:hypothetical protein